MNASLGRQVVVLIGIVFAVVIVTGASPRFIPFICIAGLLGLAGFNICGMWWRSRRRRMVQEHPFPAFLRKKLRVHYPMLTDRQIDDVERGLRQFFMAHVQSGGRFVAMPSKVVDALWHEFILHTRGYQDFCRRVFGRMLHHTPTEAMPSESLRRGDKFAGLRRAWYWSCKDEGINPRRPSRLPLLFALDTVLAIPGGYRYVPDCTLLGADRGDTHCAVGFACGSSCGSSSGASDAGVSCGSGDGGGGDAGGDGGGCGGGCGGGGD